MNRPKLNELVHLEGQLLGSALGGVQSPLAVSTAFLLVLELRLDGLNVLVEATALSGSLLAPLVEETKVGWLVYL